MTNVIDTVEQVNVLLAQGFTAKQIVKQFPKGSARWQAEGCLQAKGLLPMTKEEQAEYDSFMEVL